jgi:pimeloyl-ACP methyl ester carboxylesterase
MGSRRLEKDGLAVTSYDARGHGESSGQLSALGYDYATLVDDALAVIDSVPSSEQPFVAVGVSMGAHTALSLALQNPDRVSALVLITPGFDPEISDPDYSSWARLAEGLQLGGVDGVIEAYDFSLIDPRWREIAITATRQRMERHRDLESVVHALTAIPRSRPFDSWSELSTISVPTAVIGSRDAADPGHPLAVAKRYVEAIPAARLHVEAEGQSPFAWRGAAISEIVLETISEI